MSLINGEVKTTTEGTDENANQNANQNASTTGNWRDSLPQDLRDDPSLKAFTDIEKLAKSFVETKKMVGRKGVILPTEKDGEEAWNNFYKQVGLPESVEKYEVGTPDGVKIAPETLKWFKETAHKSGILPKQASKFLADYIGFESGLQKSASEKKANETKAEIEGLQKEWGRAFEQKITKAEVALKELVGDSEAFLVKHNLKDNVDFIKFLDKVSGLMSEDTVTGDGGGRLSRTPAEIQSEITDIFGNKSHPKHQAYLNSNHPSHQDALKYVEGLYKQLHPTS